MKTKEERKFLKVENRYFNLLKKSIEKGLSVPEKIEMLELMGQKISYLHEEFTVKKAQNQEMDLINPITDGLFLIQDLKMGFVNTYCHPIQQNIEQFAAHFQAVIDYEDALLYFEQTKDREVLEEAKENAEDLKDGYIKNEQAKVLRKEAYMFISQK